MVKLTLLAGSVALAIGAAAPAFAQQNDRALVIYGDDKCPTGTVCVRAPESQRYRIPQSLRSGPLAPKDQPWSQRAASVDTVANTGTGSCTNVGAGGWTGCGQQQLRTARAERRQDVQAEAESPLPK